MALTPEQKEVNKIASRLRQDAHRTRRLEFDTELSKIDVKDLEITWQGARDLQDTILHNRNAEADSIRRQIAELQEKLNGVNGKYEAALTEAKTARDQAYSAMAAERVRQVKAIESRYPDMSTAARYSSVVWQPPQGYLKEFAAKSVVVAIEPKKKSGRKP